MPLLWARDEPGAHSSANIAATKAVGRRSPERSPLKDRRCAQVPSDTEGS
jgi:hypothetical protein